MSADDAEAAVWFMPGRETVEFMREVRTLVAG
jgi:hypothetical protein